MKHPFDFVAGEVLLIDKPYEWTSFDVVGKVRNIVRRATGVKKIKVGHAGTLDPLATGLLILCTGKKTKEIMHIQAEDKEYTGTITLGATTPSYDLETEIDKTWPTDDLTLEQLQEAANTFVGDIMQRPPLFSAKKVDGKRAYELARKGSDLELKKNPVRIESFEIEAFRNPEVDFLIRCSKGTYIRSLAHDLGAELNNGGHLSSLRRTASGNFRVEDALTPEQFEAICASL